MGEPIVEPISWQTIAAMWQAMGMKPDKRRAILLREMSAAFVRAYNEAKSKKKAGSHPQNWKENRRLLKRIERHGKD